MSKRDLRLMRTRTRAIRAGITVPPKRHLCNLIQDACMQTRESEDGSVSVNTAEELAQCLEAIYAVLASVGAIPSQDGNPTPSTPERP